MQTIMSYTVNRTPLAWIPMRDGTKLAAKLWIPELVDKSTDESAEGEKYPAILGENDMYSEVCYCESKQDKVLP